MIPVQMNIADEYISLLHGSTGCLFAALHRQLLRVRAHKLRYMTEQVATHAPLLSCERPLQLQFGLWQAHAELIIFYV
jgi:hypothetical protein